MKNILIFLVLFSLVFWPSPVSAISVNQLVNEYPDLVSASSSSDLVNIIQKDIERLLADGSHRDHPGVMLAEDLNKLMWFKGMEVMTLSETIPFLSETEKAKLKTFLQYEINNYLLNQSYRLFETPDYTVGYTSELSSKIPSANFSWGNIVGLNGAAAWENLYGLWAFGHYSQDWPTLQNNWPEISEIYSSGVSDTKKIIAGGRESGYTKSIYEMAINSEITGRIAYARIAKKLYQITGDVKYNSAYQEALTVINSRTPVLGSYITNSSTQNQYCDYNSTDCGRDVQLNLAQFDFLTPELGRFLKDAYSSQIESVISGVETQEPWWFMGSYNLARSGGEGYFEPPLFAYEIFQAKTQIINTSISELRKKIPWKNEFNTVPGYWDILYQANITSLIRKIEGVVWTDTNIAPKNLLIPTTTISPSPTPAAIPDQNNDGKVNIFDGAYLIKNWGSTSYSFGDLDNNGTIGAPDFVLLVRSLGLVL